MWESSSLDGVWELPASSGSSQSRQKRRVASTAPNMESSSSKLRQVLQQQAEIRRQISDLQAKLVEVPVNLPVVRSSITSPKRKRPEPNQLAPTTPSPKKSKCSHKINEHSELRSLYDQSLASSSRMPSVSTTTLSSKNNAKTEAKITKLAPSTLLNKLAGLSSRQTGLQPAESVVRSTSFSEKPSHLPDHSELGMDAQEDLQSHRDRAPARDDRLALLEDIEIGPAEFKPPLDDPDFERYEPNSGINLSSRKLSHEDVQEYLRGRYYLSPSRLYSAARLLPNKQGYDVPVAGDWLTIAVVAERGPIKFSRPPVGVGQDDDGGKGPHGKSATTNTNGWKKGHPQEGGDPTPKLYGKKYVNIKLVDFGERSRTSSSATGEKAVIRGDAFLTLLLFESDGCDKVVRQDGGKPEKVYRGGSKGAFEDLAKLKEGDVIALLNPKILKPFQRASDNPHPTNNILALTPESASTIAVIGRARDLGMCSVLKKDGKVCGSWCDKRVSEVCEWHIQNAVERRRAGRAEFSIGTTGMSNSSAPKRKPAYDPTRQWGLKPEPTESTGATYVMAGHILSGSASGEDARSLYITETLGRDGQAKAKRKLSSKDTDKALQALLQRDKEGMRAVVKARGVATQGQVEKPQEGKGKQKGKGKAEAAILNLGIGEEKLHKTSYSANIIKQLGFDPAVKAGRKTAGDSVMQKKVEALAAVQCSRKVIALGPRPGQKIRSGVFKPTTSNPLRLAVRPLGGSVEDARLSHEADSDDDLPLTPVLPTPPPSIMIDLDD